MISFVESIQLRSSSRKESKCKINFRFELQKVLKNYFRNNISDLKIKIKFKNQNEI